MPGSRQYAWVTTAIDEEAAVQAAMFGKSATRVISLADTIVLVSHNIGIKFRHLLAQYFDYVIQVDLKTTVINSYLSMDLLKVYAFNMEMYAKIVVVDNNSLILQNCDALFELEKDYYITEMSPRKSKLPPVFVIKPDSDLYGEIVQLAHSPHFCMSNLFTGSCGVLDKEAVGQLPIEYCADINEFKNTKNLYPVELQKLKIISFGSSMKVTADYDTSFQNICDLRDSYLVEIQQWLLKNNNESPSRVKKYTQKEKKRNYYKDAIAIVGHSCRFPEANNSDEFWELIINGGDGIRSSPMERLELLRLDEKKFNQYKGGFLKCPIDDFDAKFFGISPREAELIDPQQRLLLEVAWEALENAAINPHSLKGGNTGVFTGVWKAEYEKIVKANTPTKAFHNVVLGNSYSATSARISNFLGLNGPNIATESGCSSSMVALHLACESLKRGETDLGLVMGANIIDIDEEGIPILSKDGHCKTFDEKADGFGRAEGIAVIVLKRLSDAVANGDRLMGIIRGSAMSNEGTSSSFGTPSKLCQEIAVRDALKNSGVKPEDVDYVEAHGTGTPVGDPIEFAALSAGYAGKRERPLIMGSVKTNIGHTESAAGLAGIIKVLLSMKHEIIPPHRNFDSLNPNINLESLPAILPLEKQPWKKNAQRVRIAGVSSFGISGTNVHALIEEPLPEFKHSPFIMNSLEEKRSHHILNLSAKTENSLDELVSSYSKYLEDNPQIDIQDFTFTANNGRANFNYRASVTGKDISELSEALKSKSFVRPVLAGKPRIAFLFTGQGSQYLGMAHGLYKTNSFFRDAFEKCGTIVKSKTGIILNEVLWENDDSQLKECVSCQLAIFCVEYALLSLLFSLGVKADFVLGHSVGEYAAAVASGIIGLEDALVLLIKRSELIAELPSGGMMAVTCSKDKGEELISTCMKGNKNIWLDIAVVNSLEEIVVAGNKDSLEIFHAFCKNNNVRVKNLAASHAFHSRHIDGILESFEKVTSKMDYKNPLCGYVSGTTGCELTVDEMRDGSYWLRHARDPVNFQKGIQTLADNGCNVFIEVGPRPILLALGMESVSSIENTLWLPTLQQNKDNWEVLLGSLGKLYVNDVNDIDWSVIDSPGNRRKLELPTYPFQRQKYWINIPEKNETKQIHPLLGKKVSLVSKRETVYSNYVNLNDFPYIKDHQVANLVIMPGAGFLEVILAAGKDLLQVGAHSKTNLQVKDFAIDCAFELEESFNYEMQVVAKHPEGKEDFLEVNVHIFSKLNGWRKHSSATLSLYKEEDTEIVFNRQNIENLRAEWEEKSSHDFYKEILKSGIHFGETFQSIDSIWSSENESVVAIPLKSVPGNLEEYLYHPIVLDAMLQAIASTMGTNDSCLFLPVGIESCFSFCGIPSSDKLFAHAQWDSKSSKGTVALYNEKNDLLFLMVGVSLVPTTIGSFLNAMVGLKNILPGMYQEIWRPRLAPFQSRVDLENLPELNEISLILEKSVEDDKKCCDLSARSILSEYIYLKLVNLFQENGIVLEKGLESSSRIIMNDYCVSLTHRKLFNRFVDIFKEEGNIVRSVNTDSWKVEKDFQSSSQILSKIENLRPYLMEKMVTETTIVDKCFDDIWNVLTGKLDAVNALFGRTDMNILDIYTKGMDTQLANCRMAKCLSHMFAKKTSSKEVAIIRIIEIGGGSASSSKGILKELQKQGISYQYTFTDVSSQFFENAKKELHSFETVDYKALDIEKDPSEQGFCPHYYDVVVASNVIHATESLRLSIRNIRKLLTDGGMLLLQEMLQPTRYVDIIFGILDGYWKFNDYDLRISNPMVSKEIWDRVLSENNFGLSQLLSNDDGGCSVLVAKALKTMEKRDIPTVGNKEAQKTWLVFCDEGSFHKSMAEKLTIISEDVMLLKNTQQSDSITQRSTMHFINMINESEFRKGMLKITDEKNVYGAVYLMAFDANDHNNNELYKKTLNFCKYFTENITMYEKVMVVTRGAVNTNNQEKVTPSGAVIWGMVKSLMNEVPKASINIVDLDPDEIETESDTKEIFNELFNSEDRFVCYRKGKKFVPRFSKFSEQMSLLTLPKGGYKIQVPKTKRIADVSFKFLRTDLLGPHEVQVVVKAMSLNFRDIFVIMKPDGFRSLFDEVGSDFAGIVSKIGPSVTKFKIGDEVFGFGRGTAASHIVTKETDVIFHKPSHFNYLEAATIPSCFLTAHYCLVTIADMKKDETVLIHVASGGVGLYAIQIAQYIGARIIATAGSHRKRMYLRSLGLENVFHSRDLSFGNEINKLTNGKGVNVVLNSLTSEGFKETTLKHCAKNARFLEIGKVNIWQPEEVYKLRPDVEYTIVDLEKVEPSVLADSMDIVNNKHINPVSYSKFDIKNIRNALNYFVKAQHIGKIVISMPELSNINGDLKAKENLFNKNATYLITGGLGGIGLVVAKWMFDFGAECLVLVGRSPPNSETLIELNKLRKKGCHILTFAADIGNIGQCENLFKSISSNQLQLPPIKGVIHSAGVLSDAIFVNQTWEKYEPVFNAKIQGCLNLHNLTKDKQLDHFVVFSSTAAVIGPIGQSNHCAANSFLDSFTHYRHSIGLPAQSINWGAWSEVGVAANYKFTGIHPFNARQGIAALQYVMSRPNLVQIAVVQLSLKELTYMSTTLSTYFEETLVETEENNARTPNSLQSDSFWEDMKPLSITDRELYIKRVLVNLLKEILKLPKGEQLNEHQIFPEMGLDSLMSVELKNKLQLVVGDGLVLSAATLADYSTISKLSEYLTEATVSQAATDCQMKSLALTDDALKELIKNDSILPDDIKGIGNFVKASQVRNIFLTGGTGHLGAHVLEQLLKIPTISIVCLVRGSNKERCRKKLLSSLKKYKLTGDFDRISVLNGDVAQEHFGIPLEDYNRLSQSIDAVYHLAAKVSFMESYLDQSSNRTDIRSVNVLGTINVLRFAGNIKTKRVFYSSSIVAINKLHDDGNASEEFPGSENNAEGMSMGYSLTKFVSEKLIGQAIERGIPSIVIRYPNVAGNSKTGHFSIGSDFALNLLFMAVKLGVFFTNDGWSLLSADIAAELTMDVLFNDNFNSEMYNLIQPNSINVTDFMNIIKSLGYHIGLVSREEFFERLQKEGNIFFSSFKSSNNPDILSSLFGSNSFIEKYILTGCLARNKLSPKLIKTVPNISERIGSSHDGVKSFLLHAQSLGLFNGSIK